MHPMSMSLEVRAAAAVRFVDRHCRRNDCIYCQFKLLSLMLIGLCSFSALTSPQFSLAMRD